MDEILASHCIDAKFLRTDNFKNFISARAETLLQRIETATGKKINREPELFGDVPEYEIYDDGPPHWDAELIEDISS